MCAGNPRAPPCSPRRAVCVGGGEESEATETGAHLNDTSYWAFVGIQEAPPRFLGSSPSTAYHTWLGKASRSQTLSERLPTKSDPVCLRASGNDSILQSGVSIFIYMPLFLGLLLCTYDWMPRWAVLPTLLSCELQACSRWISHATCHAFSHLLSAVVFSLQFST